MSTGRTATRFAAQSLTLATTFLVLLPAAGGAAVIPPKSAGSLSPVLAELARPAVRSQPTARQAAILGVPADGPGALLRRGGRVLVGVRFEHGAVASRDEVRARGGRVLSASRDYQTATVAIDPADLKSLAALPNVASVTPVREPMLFAVDCEGGSVISEGVEQLNAKEAREEFLVDGSGIEVGVLSDSYDSNGDAATTAEDDVETADLPGAENECVGQETDVDVIEDLGPEEGSDEGRAMLQIVHDMAPEADLSFATAFASEEGFAKNIEKLATQGADVIVDDVAYFEEPFFQDGPVAVAIEKVTGAGASYFSSAGNDNLFDGEGNEIASWEAPSYRDSGACPAEIAALGSEFNASHCMDFRPGSGVDRTFGIKVESGEVLLLDLQWAEPWEGVATDIDAFLLDANGELIAGSAEFNLLTQRPVEIFGWFNGTSSTQTVQLVINRFSGGNPRLKSILLQNGGGVSGVEYPRSGGGDVMGPSIFGHAGASETIAVGAVPFNDSSEPEPYSSRGPVTHYFEEAKGPGPAATLPSPEVISKPDVAATDCGRTTFFAFQSSPGVWRFCGTSAAAPHAAGVAALMFDSELAATPAEIEAALADTASPVGAFGPCAVGGGLIESVGALEAINGEISPPAAGSCSPPNASGAVFVAPGNWGLEQPPPPAPTTPSSVPATQTPPPPATSFSRHPPSVVRTRQARVRLVFRFTSNQAGVTFLCKVDSAVFRICGPRLARKFGVGRHVVKVKARNAAGLVDLTPAVFRFRVKRVA
ncbi:MAG TPA: S8 family serine peptidase [Solirubrobacterales bacterium]|nr:S8 family serine peptidase [Solirubrobacterales bacterium]